MGWVKLSLSEQMKYAKSQDWRTRIDFASYPVLPEVADFMIEHETMPDALSVICERLFRTPNSNIWASTLAKAARKKVELKGVNSEFDHALVNIALHLNTDIDTITYLYHLSDLHINWGLANNPNTPQAILDELANLDNHEIHYALLCNPNTSEETRKKINYPDGFYPDYHYTLWGIKVEASGN